MQMLFGVYGSTYTKKKKKIFLLSDITQTLIVSKNKNSDLDIINVLKRQKEKKKKTLKSSTAPVNLLHASTPICSQCSAWLAIREGYHGASAACRGSREECSEECHPQLLEEISFSEGVLLAGRCRT